MPENYYPEPDDQQDALNTPDDEETQETGDKTALLPKSVLGGKQFDIGDEVVLKIVKTYEDEVLVEYAPEKPGKSDKGESELPGDEEFDEAEGNPGMGRGRMMRGGY